jgi:hypothetical protein
VLSGGTYFGLLQNQLLPYIRYSDRAINRKIIWSNIILLEHIQVVYPCLSLQKTAACTIHRFQTGFFFKGSLKDWASYCFYAFLNIPLPDILKAIQGNALTLPKPFL